MLIMNEFYQSNVSRNVIGSVSDNVQNFVRQQLKTFPTFRPLHLIGVENVRQSNHIFILASSNVNEDECPIMDSYRPKL